MYLLIILLISFWVQGHTFDISVSVDNGPIQGYNNGDIVDVRVGTGVLLIADLECEWHWDIVNDNSPSLTTQTSGITRLLHIVPFTREEMGVYSCDYFDMKSNLTLVATGSNIFRTYGGRSIETVRNNSVVLATINSDDDILISCIQSTVLSRVMYWMGPEGSDVMNNGSVYVRGAAERGESVLVIEASDKMTEGVYTCITDNKNSYSILVYRDVYAIVRGNGEREILDEEMEIVYVSIGEEINLVCPEGSIPGYQGENEGRIEHLFQILYIPLFTYNEAGIYQCKNGITDNQVELIAINSALIYTLHSPIALANNSLISIVDDVTQSSVVCAGSRNGNGNYTGWYLNGELIQVYTGLTGENQLVRYNQSLGGLELYLPEVSSMYQGEYMCVVTVVNSTGDIGVEIHYVSVYLNELELVLVSDTGDYIEQKTVIFLQSTIIREITCKSAEFYPRTVSVNWTADTIMYSSENNTIHLPNLSQSSLYTCHASNPYSTGSISVYILSDTLNANLSVAYNNRRVEAYRDDVIDVELDVGFQNVVVECIALQAVLTLPWGEMRSDGMSINTVNYTIELVTPEYNGVVSCTGVSHEVTRIQITTIGAVLVREHSNGWAVLESGITVIEDTEYFFCIGSDVIGLTEWDKSGINPELFVRVSVYEEILRFEPDKTPEGFYTCLARNETGSIENITQGLFNADPYGPNINTIVNGTNTSVYVLNSNGTVSLECVVDSYPPAISILWYNHDQLIGNTSTIELNVTNSSIALLCVVNTVYRSKQEFVYIINPYTNITITNTTSITPLDEKSTGILIVLLLTLLIVVFVPIAIIPIYVFIHKLVPADAEIVLYWKDRIRGSSREREREGQVAGEFDRYKLNKVDYKNTYRLNELEDSLEEVKFWEPKKIKDEYEALKGAAHVGDEVYHTVQPVRMTSEVYVNDDLTRVTHRQTDVHKTDEVAKADSSTNSFDVTDDCTPLLEKEDRNFEPSWEEEHIKSMLDIDECPGFFIVKELFGNPGRLSEKELKVNYLNFLFHRKPDDVVFIGYCPEDNATKCGEFIFYPHGPKDKRFKVKNDKKGNDKKENNERVYYISTISYFSSQFYTMRQLRIREENTNNSLEIRLFNFLTWPQVEIGSKTYPFIEFVLSFWCKKQTPFRKKSIVLHCDAGARCATFISIYYLLRRTRKNENFNLFEFFVKLYNQGRQKELELFPTHTQYEFLHSIILDLTLTSTTCQSGELDSKYKKLFELPRDYNPWREDRMEIFMKTLEELVVDASKDLKIIAEEREAINTELDTKYQKQQKKRAERHESLKESKDKKKESEQTGVEKEEETYRSDDEIEYVEDRGKFVSSFTGQLIPEALFIKTDTAANRFKKERKQKDNRNKTQKDNRNKTQKDNRNKTQKDPFDETENSKKEYKQLKLYKPYLLNTFANSPAYTHYRTHKKHLEGGRAEAVEEQNNKENGKKDNLRRRKDIYTNKRALNIEEKLSMDECTRYELFLFGAGQVQVYGPNITDENQSQGFWLHSIYGEEIIATRHPCVNDFEYANHNNPQFNLHLYKQQRVSTVIALCTFEELIEAYTAKKKLRYDNSKRDGKQPMSPYWPPIGQDENFGPFKVKTVATGYIDDKKLMQWFDLEYKDTNDMDRHNIKVFLCKDWPTLMETNHTTGRHDRFVQFMTKVEAYTKESKSEKIAVHCSDTKPYSAQFSAVFYALRQNDTEGKIDMYQIAKGIQISRRHTSGFVTEDQYFLSMALTSDCLLSVAKNNEENSNE
ncbi:hypothetical protein LOD99_3567 [Oopsacas minuta]|uniref:protein-tyrosine-phosphatase n=1 Tax=Oopsacas minuta TaxID=111878 RepID=A0AAV7JWW5_9METZ|nr:hypothetical protein LOD99_3567 [Oopsacas minuta]